MIEHRTPNQFQGEDQEKTSRYVFNKQYVAILKYKVFNKSEEKWSKVEESGK
jgi:hypothetical protein